MSFGFAGKRRRHRSGHRSGNRSGGMGSLVDGMGLASYGKNHHNPVVGMAGSGLGSMMSSGGSSHSAPHKSASHSAPHKSASHSAPHKSASPSQIRCPYCSFTYQTVNEFTDHLHLSHAPIACAYPDCAFSSRTSYDKHTHEIQVHKSQCVYCHIYVDQDQLDAHHNANHPILHCKNCSASASFVAVKRCGTTNGISYETRFSHEFARHTQDHHMTYCASCFRFIETDVLKGHYQSIHNINTDQCQYCEKVCSTGLEYVEHIKTSHQMHCEVDYSRCHMVYPTKALLDEHRLVMHPVCKTCKKQCYDQTALLNHQTEVHPSCCVVM
jgi:hypothetical protein